MAVFHYQEYLKYSINKKGPGSALFLPWRAIFATAVLNFRVRDGNGCDHRAKATGLLPFFSAVLWIPNITLQVSQVVDNSVTISCLFVKLSPRAISISLLNALLRLQIWPINPLTLGGPYFLRMGSLILGRASRLDAFSAYLFRR